MTPSALAILLLGGAAVAVVASSSSPSKAEPEDDELVRSAQEMVLLFNLYTAQTLHELDDDELYALAKLNTTAKHQPLTLDKAGVAALARAQIPSVPLAGIGNVQGISIPAAVRLYRTTLFLPPGAAARRFPLASGWVAGHRGTG